MASPLKRALTAASNHMRPAYWRTTQHRHLPVCTVQTNQPRSALPGDFNEGLSKVLAKALGKDEAVVSVGLKTDIEICRAGNNDPNAIVQVWSFAVFDEERNPAYVKAIYDYLIPSLNMPADKIALFLHPIEKHDAGHLTYAQMMTL